MLRKLSIKKISLVIILLYFIAYFPPVLFALSSQNAVLLATTIGYILGALAMIILYLNTQKREKISIEKPHSKAWFILLLGILGIFGATIIQAIAFMLEVAITGNELESQNTQNIMNMLSQYPVFILAITIGGPIMEEFVFRRSLVGLTESYIGIWFSIFLSASLFSIFHFDGHFLIYFFLGVFLSLLYKWTGSIWTSIIAHCGMNALVVLSQFFS